MSGVRTPSRRLSRTMTRTLPPRRRNASSCSSAHRRVLDSKVSSRTLLRLWPSVRTNSRVRRYVPVPGCRTIGPRPAQGAYEPADAGIPSGKPVVIDEVLPDGHGVTAPAEGELDQLAVGLA